MFFGQPRRSTSTRFRNPTTLTVVSVVEEAVAAPHIEALRSSDHFACSRRAGKSGFRQPAWSPRVGPAVFCQEDSHGSPDDGSPTVRGPGTRQADRPGPPRRAAASRQGRVGPCPAAPRRIKLFAIGASPDGGRGTYGYAGPTTRDDRAGGVFCCAR